MSWQLIEVPNPFFGQHARPWNDLPPGSCWKVTLADLDINARRPLFALPLSPEFHASGRDYVIWMVLPGGAEWSPDRLSTESQRGWIVTGEFPRITVSPSVHQLGRYHGFVRDGVLTDDLEGRHYGAAE